MGWYGRRSGIFEEQSLNNNRGSNRRRGRGGNRQQGNQPPNRIDSRARGNAPQLHDKYKKMAHDAHLNGDRVQEEYYLQFADHYFRVIADQKQRQEEARERRREERPQDDSDSYGDRDERDEDSEGYRGRTNGRSSQDDDDDSADGDEDSVYEAAENPFIRSNRSKNTKRPRHPRRDTRGDDSNSEDRGDDSDGLDPTSLPPAISSDSEEADAPTEKPKRRASRKRPAPDGGEALEKVD